MPKQDHKLINKYLQRNAICRDFAITPTKPNKAISGCVLIPACRESQFLKKTLSSLSNCQEIENWLILVVVNNRKIDDKRMPASPETIADNQKTLSLLPTWNQELKLNITAIDAASTGNELPENTGVGMARKIGCDSLVNALESKYFSSNISLPDFPILHLDADTIVEKNYLLAMSEALNAPATSATVANYAHQKAESEAAEIAIQNYEAIMRYYEYGLKLAGSPYAFAYLGSAMGAKIAHTINVGGIPQDRQAGEDFYFLQKLAKIGNITQAKTTVHPSARFSDRVPFGTGIKIKQLVDTENQHSVWNPNIFYSLFLLIKTIQFAADNNISGEELLESIPCTVTAEFMEKRNLATRWNAICRQFHSSEQRLKSFHSWFDALATRKLITHLEQNLWQPVNDIKKARQELEHLTGQQR